MFALVNLKTKVNEKYHKNVSDTYLDGKNFDNTRGHQMITVNGLADSNIAGKAINIAAYGAKDKYTNKDGVSNIDVLAAKTSAKGSSVNIGLQNMQYLGSLNMNHVYLI